MTPARGVRPERRRDESSRFRDERRVLCTVKISLRFPLRNIEIYSLTIPISTSRAICLSVGRHRRCWTRSIIIA